MEPSLVRVPVYATGFHNEFKQPVAYLATEDSDVFVAVWMLPASSEPLAQDQLYQHCQKMLSGAPPTDMDGKRAVAEVLLPKFHLRGFAASQLSTCSEVATAFGQPRELFAMQLSVRPMPPGALRPRPRT